MTALVIADPTGALRRSLRRFTYSTGALDRGDVRSCPIPLASGHTTGCDAETVIGVVPGTAERHVRVRWPADDWRWPARCVRCRQPFAELHPRFLADRLLYRPRDGSGEPFTWDEMPVGAMIRIAWFDETVAAKGAPGPMRESWDIRLPDGGHWYTTQPASGGGYWTVTGMPPRITVAPSIFHNPPSGWHGHIVDGYLA